MEGLCHEVSSRYELSWSFCYFNNLELEAWIFFPAKKEREDNNGNWVLMIVLDFINIYYLVVKLEF